MNFSTVNETDRFEYRDCIITDIEFSDNNLVLSLDALIVKANNSQNSNYTDSYAGATTASFDNASINELTKLGYKRYDANDKLIEEIPNENLKVDNDFIKSEFKGAYLPEISREDDSHYTIIVEIPGEDAYSITTEYSIKLSCNQVVIEWDKYLNRVQSM